MTRCSSCSGAVDAGQRYCLACGERLPGAPAPPETVPPAPPVAPAPAPRAAVHTPWRSDLPGPRAAAALVLMVLAFGVATGATTGPAAEATAGPGAITVALAPQRGPTPAPAVEPVPTHRRAAPSRAPAPAAARPAASAARVPAPTAATTPEPTTTSAPDPTPTATPEAPPVKHVFVVWLAGHGVATTFAADSPASYLNAGLRPQGALLAHYDAIGHGSVANGIAALTGQGPNVDTAADCADPTAFSGRSPRASDGQAIGHGCRFGPGVPTLFGRLAAVGHSARAYAQEGCDAPHPRVPSSYLAESACSPLAQLDVDLASATATPSLVWISPGPCDAGVDGACPAGEPDGLARMDAFLRTLAPKLLASPAYADGGALIVLFDQGAATGPGADFEACCNQPRGPNEPVPQDPQEAPAGGGRAGALVLSRFTKPGATVRTPYNHYALLRSLAAIFGVQPPGYAGAKGLDPFGGDVWSGR